MLFTAAAVAIFIYFSLNELLFLLWAGIFIYFLL